MSIGYGFADEDFQNRGTFIVVRSSVFALSSAHKAQLARDAYNALWDSRRRNQEQYCSPGSGNQCEKYSVLKPSRRKRACSARAINSCDLKTFATDDQPEDNQSPTADERLNQYEFELHRECVKPSTVCELSILVSPVWQWTGGRVL